MKKAPFLFFILSSVLFSSFTKLNEEPGSIQFDGFYAGKTGEIDIPGNKIEMFNYIRFYQDGTVYTQTVTSNNPQAVAKWFGKEGRFERSGTYKINGDEISFTVSNDQSPDKQLEGARTEEYIGKIMKDGRLALTITYQSGEWKEAMFEFNKVE